MGKIMKRTPKKETVRVKNAHNWEVWTTPKRTYFVLKLWYSRDKKRKPDAEYVETTLEKCREMLMIADAIQLL